MLNGKEKWGRPQATGDIFFELLRMATQIVFTARECRKSRQEEPSRIALICYAVFCGDHQSKRRD